MGSTPQAVPNRIARGEPVDVIIVVGDALDKLIEDGKVVASSRSDLARSLIGAAVQAGTPKPDISSVEAFKKTLVNARSIAYSDSASGVYIETVLYKRLDVSDEVKAKSKMIPAEPVGEIIARRCRAWFPADERAYADKGHRRFGADSVGNPKGDRILRRPCRQCAGARSWRCFDQVSLGADGRSVYYKKRHGTHWIPRERLIVLAGRLNRSAGLRGVRFCRPTPC